MFKIEEEREDNRNQLDLCTCMYICMNVCMYAFIYVTKKYIPTFSFEGGSHGIGLAGDSFLGGLSVIAPNA